MSNVDWKWLEVLCQDFDRARSLTVLLMVRYGEWDQLVKLRCYPSDYSELFQSIDDFRFDYQITELLRKNSDLPLNEVDPEAACLEKFFDAEHHCAETNARMLQLKRQLHGDWFNSQTRIDSRWEDVVKALRKDLREILGPIPDELNAKFSSGSTFNNRRFILPQDKMSSRATVTEQAYEVIEPFWSKTLWARGLFSEHPNRSAPLIVKGNRFCMVPKDATTHRGICIEPSLNVTHQLSVGSYLRKRLERYSIDLTHGQDLHKRLAERGSFDLSIGTIDLSSASDTVALEFCRLVLPPMWFDLLDCLRSPSTRINRSWRRNAKFSSMGNGFTFELETMLFFSIARTVCKLIGHNLKILKVYGDDIIIDREVAGKLVTALKFFGFIPNPRKTFWDFTPFRESCGGDYYRGTNVRGHYLETLPKEPIDYIKLANGIRRMAQPDLHAFNDLYRYKRCWLRVINALPSHISRCRGPAVLGDIVLHDNPETWYVTAKGGRKYIRTIQPCFPDEAFTSYDRKFWTRDSIIAAATLGLLRDQGDTISDKEVIIPGKQRVPRYEPSGHEVKKIEFFYHQNPGLPERSLEQYFRRLERNLKRSSASFASPC